LKKLIALAAAGILTLSVAAFADDAAKPTETKSTETTSTSTETMKKDDAGTMKKTTKKKSHKKSVKKDGTKTETKTDSKASTTEAAPKTN
jgi:hypothetical protein